MVSNKVKRTPNINQPPGITDYLRDIRVIQGIAQVVFVIFMVFAIVLLWTSILDSLEDKNLAPGFDFLDRRAGFDIGEAPDWYTTDATYGQAFSVGVVNTLKVVFFGLFGATVLGVLFGVLLLSKNWLIRTISRIYVELLRNTPLLVQLIFWYFVVMLGLPSNDITIPNEGVAIIPWRYFIYIVLFAILWLYAWLRSSYPSRITTGALSSVLIMEISYRIFDISSNELTLLFALLGLIIVIFSWFAADQWKGLMIAVAIIPLVQLFAHLAIHILSLLQIVFNHPQEFRSEVFPSIFIGLKGFLFPSFFTTTHFSEWLAFVGLGFILAFTIWIYSGHVTETTGKPIPRGTYAILAIVGFAIIGWIGLGLQPVSSTIVIEGEDGIPMVLDVATALEDDSLTIVEEQKYSSQAFFMKMPKKNRFGRTEIGTEVSLEYMGLLLGLIIYTSAFIAEIVRAGIQAVPYGQIEAARALGLSGNQTLMRVILPQALRVIIPPMGNQYLNLSKNSSLAVAIAYADTYQVGTTMMNQSGQSVTGFVLVLVVYLSLSLLISLIMNFANSRFQLVTR